MPSDHGQDTPRWYVLNFIGSSARDLAQKAIDRYNAAAANPLELFAPTYVVREERQGELKFRTVSLTFHYVFVRGPFDDVKSLCALSNGFSFLIDRGSQDRYAIIDDRKMAHFKNIARAYKNCLPYFPIDQIDLEAGDLVEVVSGDFPGLVGYYMPRPKSTSGNILLNVFNNVGTVAFDVRATDVRVLEFARRTTRANDQIDAFVPHLLKALRLYAAGDPLTTPLAAKLSAFCGRLGAARINNRKLDARLQALLYAANHIIGNTAEARRHLTRYHDLSPAVTNPWTRALITLILTLTAAPDTATTQLRATYHTLTQLTPTSKSQHDLLTEYLHHLPTTIPSAI